MTPPLTLRVLIGLVCLLVGAATLPRLVCGRPAAGWYDGERETQTRLAVSVADAVTQKSDPLFYHTGNARFDGQSAIAIYQMAILGLGQIVLEHPSERERYLPAMRAAADRLVAPATLTYAAKVYGQHGAVRMDPGEGHGYLGYINLALGMLRQVEPETRHAALHDRLSNALSDRIAASPTGLIETYPGETWPPDVAAVVGSIGLHARVTGTDRSALLETWAARFARCAIDSSGYLVQRVTSGGCKALDAPRGSGTAVAAYFLGFAHPELARRLHAALVGVGRRSLFGFAAMREYAPGHSGSGDVNAGPIVLGVSVGATGFAIGSSRTHRDRDLFVGLYRTLHLFGVPVGDDERQSFAVGGSLGNALILAMLTARPA